MIKIPSIFYCSTFGKKYKGRLHKTLNQKNGPSPVRSFEIGLCCFEIQGLILVYKLHRIPLKVQGVCGHGAQVCVHICIDMHLSALIHTHQSILHSRLDEIRRNIEGKYAVLQRIVRLVVK